MLPMPLPIDSNILFAVEQLDAVYECNFAAYVPYHSSSYSIFTTVPLFKYTAMVDTNDGVYLFSPVPRVTIEDGRTIEEVHMQIRYWAHEIIKFDSLWPLTNVRYLKNRTVAMPNNYIHVHRAQFISDFMERTQP
jgi:hypothetical protein